MAPASRSAVMGRGCPSRVPPGVWSSPARRQVMNTYSSWRRSRANNGPSPANRAESRECSFFYATKVVRVSPGGSSMNELLGMTLMELTQALRARKASPLELMRATLARVDATHADLNAVVARRDPEELLRDARTAEARITRSEARPLEGIPLGVEDLEDAEGLVTSQGSLPFRDRVATRDSTQVQRLRAAGAIVLGKTNAPEFGYTAITKNLVYGVTRSPWNLERSPGGSSGGSAAALSACVLPLVTASDGGGSIRIPASFTGSFGLKTSFGRIPRGPFEHWEYQDTSVVGPLTKTVEDAALFLDQVVGASPYDPNSLPHPGLSYLKA